MSRELDLETLTRPGGIVPVDIGTTAALVRHVLRLRTALQPFAEAARSFTPYNSELEGQTVETSFTLAQLRAAAEALSSGKQT